jgi:hypothetical protein
MLGVALRAMSPVEVVKRDGKAQTQYQHGLQDDFAVLFRLQKRPVAS